MVSGTVLPWLPLALMPTSSSEFSSESTDQELVARLNRGDHGAFELLYRRYGNQVLALAWRYTGHREDALDVVQDTFSYVLSKFPGFELRARFMTFLYPVVRHLARDRARKWRAQTGSTEDLDEDQVRAPEQRETRHEDLVAVLSVLPAGQREVLLMRFVDGFSMREIATALDIPEGTVKSRLHLALKTLQHDGRTRAYFDSG